MRERIDKRVRSFGATSLARCIVVLLVAFSVASCSKDDVTVKEPPSIYSVGPVLSAPGDTVTVTGEGFLRDWSGLEIAFSGSGFNNTKSYRASKPFSIIDDGTLLVEVPDGAFSGSARIQWDNPLSGSGPFRLEGPPLISGSVPIELSQNPGNVAKVFFSGSDLDFDLRSMDGPSEYMFVLFSDGPALESQEQYAYLVESPDAIPVDSPIDRLAMTRSGGRSIDATSVREDKAGEAARLLGKGELPVPLEFGQQKRDEYKELLGSIPPASTLSENRSGEGLLRAAPGTAVFYVYSDWEGSTVEPSSFTEVTATLEYEGEHTLLYVDEDTPSSCLTSLDADQLGASFDESIYATDRAAFGSESDINSDGKVAILLSPVINLMTPPGAASTTGFIAGFFLPGDLLPAYMPAGATNGMEIFYTMVPDPEGIYGNTYEKTRALEVIRGVLAHEFLHMIMFNYRVLIYGGGVRADFMPALWVNEGLAHIAEDLNGHFESNIARAGLFLSDPGAVTLIHGGDALEERGAAFLFFRYLGDRYGESVFKALVQSRTVGVANIEYVTGQDFFEIFADWAATLFLDGKNITTDERFEFTSIDLSGDFTPLGVTGHDFGIGPANGEVNSMGPEFITFSMQEGEIRNFSIAADPGSRMNILIVRIDH